MSKTKCTAIVLAAGQGSRMGTKVRKQYLEIQGKPILYYTLRVFEDSPLIDEVVLVTGVEDIAYCREEIVGKYHMDKVKHIVVGGIERYHSVWNGLQTVTQGYVFIHDGARPFVDESILRRVYDAVQREQATAVGMPVKDTIKVIDEEEFAVETPARSTLWLVQTPQAFEVSLIKDAYARIMLQDEIRVTDDATVVEQMLGMKIKMVQGSYENIKITTPEDLVIANEFLKIAQNNFEKVVDN